MKIARLAARPPAGAKTPAGLGAWKSADDVEWATLTYVDWFNNRRLHGEIGMILPAEYEEHHYRQTTAA